MKIDIIYYDEKMKVLKGQQYWPNFYRLDVLANEISNETGSMPDIIRNPQVFKDDVYYLAIGLEPEQIYEKVNSHSKRVILLDLFRSGYTTDKIMSNFLGVIDHVAFNYDLPGMFTLPSNVPKKNVITHQSRHMGEANGLVYFRVEQTCTMGSLIVRFLKDLAG